MLESSPAAAAAITGRERTFSRTLRVDWNRTGAFDHALSDLSDYVLTWTREHVLSSTAPDELMLIEGNSAARLEVHLAGMFDGRPLSDQFAPYNRGSVFYQAGLPLTGVTVRFSVAVWHGTPGTSGWEEYEQFTGVLRDYDTSRGDGQVVLSCLDNAERFRTPVGIAPYGLFQGYLQDGYKRGGLIDSSSVIDLAGRAGEFTMGPQRWAHFDGQAEVTGEYGPILSVPFHGSVLPEVGTLDGDCSFHLTEDWETNQFAYRAEAYRPGPHGYLALNAVPPERTDWGYKKYWLDEWGEQGGSLIGRSWVLGCWLHWEAPNASPDSAPVELRIRGSLIQIVVEGSNGGVAARVIENNGLTSTSTFLFMRQGWNYLQATMEFEGTTAYAIQVRVNDTTAAENRFEAQNLTNVNDVLSGLARIENFYAVSDVYICGHQNNLWLGSFTYDTTPLDTARVSWGRNRMAYTVRETGREAFDLAKDVAGAEFGVVMFDEAGRLCFYTYTDVQDRQTDSVRRFTLDDLDALSFRSTLDSVRNIWTVTTKSGRALSDTIYDLGSDGVPLREDARSGELVPDIFQIPGHGNKVWFVPVDEYAISVYPYGIPNIEDPSGADAPGYWDQYVPTHGKMTYTGLDFRHNTGAASEQKFVSRNLFRLAMGNGWAETVGFVNPEGSPRFRVSGLLVREDAPRTWTIRDQESIDRDGPRVIELDESFWRQDEWQTRAMLSDLVARMGRAIPVSDDISVPGDPRVQVLDCIEVTDPSGFGQLIRMQIYGLTRSEDEQGRLVDTYRVEAIRPPAPGIWDSTSNGAWDSTFIWS